MIKRVKNLEGWKGLYKGEFTFDASNLSEDESWKGVEGCKERGGKGDQAQSGGDVVSTLVTFSSRFYQLRSLTPWSART